MGTDPVVDSRTGKVVGMCYSRECSAGCGKDSLDLPLGVHQCEKCKACPECCICTKVAENKGLEPSRL